MAISRETQIEEQRGFFQRFGFVLGVLAVGAVVGAIVLGQSLSRAGPPAHRMPEVQMVKIISTPPPPPPPPPPQPKMAEEKMVEQVAVDDTESKPEAPAAPATADVGTSIKGDGGPDAFGLGGNRSGGTIGGGGPRSSGSKWGWYAAQVQSSLSEALRRNARTREAAFRIEVRIWPDLTGRVVRSQLVSSTGDSAVDAALKAEVLNGLQLKEPPPEGMPLPIVMRLTARRPN
jgi:outer membrane biosynthesis protein TonB